MCIKIDEQGEYYAFYKLFQHIVALDVYTTPYKDFNEHIFSYVVMYKSELLSEVELEEYLKSTLKILKEYLKN